MASRFSLSHLCCLMTGGWFTSHSLCAICQSIQFCTCGLRHDGCPYLSYFQNVSKALVKHPQSLCQRVNPNGLPDDIALVTLLCTIPCSTELSIVIQLLYRPLPPRFPHFPFTSLSSIGYDMTISYYLILDLHHGFSVPLMTSLD